jgi:hypothetical protein
VKQAGRYANRVEVEFGQNICNFKWVNEIRLAGLSDLSPVLSRREEVSATKQVLIGARVVLRTLSTMLSNRIMILAR